jgi:antitoxin component YwqK of YwqJK toxin-antitoxin module
MQEIKLDQIRYKTNWELLEQLDALTAHQLRIRGLNNLHFCVTEKNELNIYKTRYGLIDYYHSQEGALDQARQIISEDFLQNAQLIYMYGLGMGYMYAALKDWLHEKSNRYLILFEDDLEVIHCFLYGELAETLLRDRQVFIFYFQDIQEDYLRFCQLHSNFLTLKPKFLALPYYAYRKEDQTRMICYRIFFDHNLISMMHQEYLSGQSGFLKNFYHNLLSLPEHHLAQDLFGQFKNKPAIICGAGPSLENNIELLKTLSDRAIIFAGGSALNVINAYGLTPHFGVGIDPNPEQYHRFLTNHTFHIPFFYRSRMAYQALQLIPGPKIYVAGSYSLLAAWFEEQLNIYLPKIDEGHNVVNFCTEIARFLGCHPIIYVGMDLAFTQIKTYASGIATHPLWLGKSNPYQHQKDQQLITVQGIDGQAIQTKWDWMAESDWLSQYARRHADTQMINASEGGLGFSSIPNESLLSVSRKYLQQSYDWEDAIHAGIQMGTHSINRYAIILLINKLKDSLNQCHMYCSSIIQEIAKDSRYTSTAILNETLLNNELGYQHFLKSFDQTIQFILLSHDTFKKSIQSPLTTIFTRYQFLENVIAQHLNFIHQAMQQFIFSPPPLKQHRQPIPPDMEQSQSRLEGDHILIEDSEIHLSIQDLFKPDDAWIQHHPTGALKTESFYLNGHLHGPVRFYSINGIILAETWFLHGKRQGKSLQRYSSGHLYSVRHYQDHLLTGTQLYLFENGVIHLSLPYQQGRLNGTVSIYNVEGQIQREIQYQNGSRHGYERLWNANGQLVIECEYQNGQPFRTARQWHSNGQLEKEIHIYSAKEEDFDSFVWDETGKLIQQFRRGIEDYTNYYEQKQEQADFIEGSVKLIMDHVEKLLKEQAIQPEDEELIKGFKSLQEELNRIKTLKADLDTFKQQNLEQAEQARQQKERLSTNEEKSS